MVEMWSHDIKARQKGKEGKMGPTEQGRGITGCQPHIERGGEDN